jgi:hypothetical protein
MLTPEGKAIMDAHYDEWYGRCAYNEKATVEDFDKLVKGP